MQNAFLNKKLYNLEKRNFSKQNDVKKNSQQPRCFVEKTSRKTRGYNKKWLTRGKRQFSTQNGVKT